MSDEGEHRVTLHRPYRARRSATSLAVAVLAFIVIANSAEAEPMKIRLTLNGTVTYGDLVRQRNDAGLHLPVAPDTHDERFVRSREVRAFAESDFGRGKADADV